MINSNPEKKYTLYNTGLKWDKTLPAEVRRNLILKAHHGNELAAAQTLKTLANVTKDQETRQLAATDAVYLLKMFQNYSKPHIAIEPLSEGRIPEKEGLVNKGPAE
jgi:hypothetical protein